MNTDTSREKPLGGRSYGSIGHLPGSRLEHNHARYATGKRAGKDFGVQEGTARICTSESRKGDVVIVQEKLDGSNVAVANVGGELVPIIRSGYRASTSKYKMHRYFHHWVMRNLDLFSFLEPEERVCGEWLMQAHGTRYRLPHAPFVAFDLIAGPTGWGGRVPRLTHTRFMERCGHLVTPHVLHIGDACSVERALSLLDPSHHGAIDPIEGCVWRVEREGRVDILAKYVRPDKVDGCYLPEQSGLEPVWNVTPAELFQ